MNAFEGIIILKPLPFQEGSWNVNPRVIEGLEYSWILRSLIVSQTGTNVSVEPVAI
jgi:hypothetical protein